MEGKKFKKCRKLREFQSSNAAMYTAFAIIGIGLVVMVVVLLGGY